jgi:hypothetical protein
LFCLKEKGSVNHLPDNKTELLPGLLPFVPNMPVLLTDNIACELGLSNGTRGIFRELVYDDQEVPDGLKVKSDVFPLNTIYVRKPLYALVEINTSQVETSLDGLRPKLIPIPLVKKQFTVPIKQLFGRLFQREQHGTKFSKVIQARGKRRISYSRDSWDFDRIPRISMGFPGFLGFPGLFLDS